MEKDKIKKGKFGEEIARRFLTSLGYQLLASNFRTRLGEIDIIAKDKEDIVFVEVKTRSGDKWGMGGGGGDGGEERKDAGCRPPLSSKPGVGRCSR